MTMRPLGTRSKPQQTCRCSPQLWELAGDAKPSRSRCSKSNKCFNRVGRRNLKCSKLGMFLSCSNGSQGMDSLNPTQRFTLNQATLTKRGWGGLSKCSQGSQDVLKCSSISTHEWVKSWGINTPSHKTSRCPVSVRPVRPVP